MTAVFSRHARIEIQRRKIEKRHALKVMKNPQQRFKVGDNCVYQSKYFDRHLKKEMLLRVFIKEDIKSLLVITLYKTSKINKYWRT